MTHRRLLPFVEPIARAWPIGIAQRPRTSPSVAGEVDQTRLELDHLLRRRHLAPLEFAANQRTPRYFAGNVLDCDRADAPF